jgi:multiple sugar transport system substrate-binding protein
MRSIRKPAAAAAAALVLTGLAACSGSSGGEQPTTPGGKTAITVVSLKPGSEQAAFDAFEDQVRQFEALHPDIDVSTQEYEWTGPTFTAQLAGGTLPTVFTVPFTDGAALVERGQLADITEPFTSFGYVDKFSKPILATGQGKDGHIYGVPTEAYGVGLQYNRTLFQQAGLDPDKPPTTWDEVRADAKQIEATVDSPAAKQALTRLHQMRWEDRSMGENILFNWTGINQDFAAGKIGMYMGGSDVYTSLKQQNNIDPNAYGLAVLPLAPGADSGVLGGGTLAAVNVKATPEQQKAAAQWIDFYYLGKFVRQDAAVQDAKTLADGGQPVGVPKLPIFDEATLDQYNSWIQPYVNVPLAQMSSFTKGIFDQKLAGEPPAQAQEMYAVLDTVVQAVLSDPNANVDQLLGQADSDVQTIIDRG